MFVPTILLQGGVVGTWKRELKKDAVSVTPYFFTSPKRLKRTPSKTPLPTMRIFSARTSNYPKMPL